MKWKKSNYINGKSVIPPKKWEKKYETVRKKDRERIEREKEGGGGRDF